jgi:hypothetical protein
MDNELKIVIALSLAALLYKENTSMLPRGIRNNNAGNIRKSTAFTWQGETGQDSSGYVIFDKPENGIRALYRTLMTYRNKHAITTVRGIISRWAPAADNNNTQSYINHAAGALSVSPDTVLQIYQYPALVKVIIQHENGVQPYSDKVISDGIAAA